MTINTVCGPCICCASAGNQTPREVIVPQEDKSTPWEISCPNGTKSLKEYLKATNSLINANTRSYFLKRKL